MNAPVRLLLVSVLAVLGGGCSSDDAIDAAAALDASEVETEPLYGDCMVLAMGWQHRVEQAGALHLACSTAADCTYFTYDLRCARGDIATCPALVGAGVLAEAKASLQKEGTAYCERMPPDCQVVRKCECGLGACPAGGTLACVEQRCMVRYQ